MQSEKKLEQVSERIERAVGTLTISIALFFGFFWIIDRCGGYVIGRFNSSENYFPKEVYLEPHPFVGYGGTHSSDLQRSAGLNELGYRGPVPSQPKKSSEYRIILIGGSTVLTGNPTISELVQNYFNELNRSNVAVYNFGVAASTLRMDIARTVFEVGSYEPDLIIFYGGGNDIGLPYQADPRPGYPPNFLAYEYNPLLLAGTAEQEWGTLLKLALFHSRIARMYAGDRIRQSLVPLDLVRQQNRWNTPEWSRKIAETYLEDVKRANQVSHAFGARALFIFQPILPFKLIPTSVEKNLIETSLWEHAARCRSIITAGLSKLHEHDQISYADASAVFDSVDREVFLDGIHIHQEYQQNVAKAVFEASRYIVG